VYGTISFGTEFLTNQIWTKVQFQLHCLSSECRASFYFNNKEGLCTLNARVRSETVSAIGGGMGAT